MARAYDARVALTFCECSEPHVGMDKNGQQAEHGFSCLTLKDLAHKHNAEYYDLGEYAPAGQQVPEAGLLVIRNYFKSSHADSMFLEQLALQWDRKVFMYGGVRNKRARWNLCYDYNAQEPDYAQKKGRVVPWSSLPQTSIARSLISRDFDLPLEILRAEGNYYYDKSCGIGFHGDAERKIVVGVSLGRTMPLVFRWYHQCEPQGTPFQVEINHRDLYIMSDYATGNNWKHRSKWTLRHAAGAPKYVSPKPRKRSKKRKVV